MEIYRKIWSDNPCLYKEITEKQAIQEYCNYLLNFTNHLNGVYIPATGDIAYTYGKSGDLREAKSFREWLETEI